MDAALTAARVAIVSGKGGVGKTTLAAALAMAGAGAGKDVLLAELEDREAFAPIFGKRRVGYQPERLAPRIEGLTVEADEALVEYLQVMYKIPRVSRALIRSRAVEFATNTAPGLKDILLIGKVRQAELERTGGRPRYDLVVVDAPPTGRLPRFLNAPAAIVDLVGAGPIRRQAKTVLDLVRDPVRLQVVLVTLPEAMPVRETLETAEALREMEVTIGPIIANGLLEPIEGLGDDPLTALTTSARETGVDLDDAALKTLADVAAHHARRAANQAAALTELRAAAPVPVVEVPFLPGGAAGQAEIARIADALTASGAL